MYNCYRLLLRHTMIPVIMNMIMIMMTMMLMMTTKTTIINE